ncbi:MAG: serine protease, partial [Pseudomonadota bacterium]
MSTNEERSSTVWVLSAWHCFEDYRDLSRDILFTTVNGQSAKARLVSSGGSMRADWALLKLD